MPEYGAKTNKSVIITMKSPHIVKLHHIRKYSIVCIYLSHGQWMLAILHILLCQSHSQVQPVVWPRKVARSQEDFREKLFVRAVKYKSNKQKILINTGSWQACYSINKGLSKPITDKEHYEIVLDVTLVLQLGSLRPPRDKMCHLISWNMSSVQNQVPKQFQ